VKAIIQTKNGPPEILELQEIAKPVPKDNEILVKVHAATVTPGDVMLRKLHPLLHLPMRLFGLRVKKIPGHEFAGQIESVGKHVQRFKPGERVFGTTTGLSVGANAEYVCVPEECKTAVLAKMPVNATYQEAAALPVGGMTALFILDKANLQNGQAVLVYGASGSVGSYGVQLAKYYGATVTGVCSTSNVDMVKSLGADEVIDYKNEDFTKNGQIYDVILDAAGKISPTISKAALKPDGRYLTVRSMTRESNEHLLLLKELVEKGDIKPVIDRFYPLERIAEAHQYVEGGHKKGNVVIVVTQ